MGNTMYGLEITDKSHGNPNNTKQNKREQKEFFKKLVVACREKSSGIPCPPPFTSLTPLERHGSHTCLFLFGQMGRRNLFVVEFFGFLHSVKVNSRQFSYASLCGATATDCVANVPTPKRCRACRTDPIRCDNHFLHLGWFVISNGLFCCFFCYFNEPISLESPKDNKKNGQLTADEVVTNRQSV